MASKCADIEYTIIQNVCNCEKAHTQTVQCVNNIV